MSKNFVGVGDSGLVRKLVDGFVAVFLLTNLVIRFSTMFHYPPYNGYIAVFLGCVVLACGFVVVFQRYLKAFLFMFGFSFFLFGFPPMDMQSRIFELIVTCVATALFLINWREGNDRGQWSVLSGRKRDGKGGLNRHLVLFISCYVVLSLFSLLLIPLRQIFKDFWFFGFPDFFFYVSIGQPYSIYYPLPAATRLILYVALAVQLASLDSQTGVYKSIFLGLFSGVVFCAFIGLLDFYGMISLAWYRFGGTTTPGVLHSTFGNRGVFGEFVLTVVPFVLIGIMSKTKRVWMQVLLFGSLIICEIALILAGARAGWVSYPLILLICWVFFYSLSEKRIESFRFNWKDLVKVAISVPITILISFLLVFQVFTPFTKYLESRDDSKSITVGFDNTMKIMKNQASTLIDPVRSRRFYTWAEGYHVGRESPLFGVGYETYCWHAHVLADISESGLSRFYKANSKYIDLTPHNIFFQFFVDGGLVGLGLWLLIVGYAIMILLFDVIRNNRLLSIPVIISIISFHAYGMFQSMQYIPMVWSLIFLSLGYAMTVDENVVPEGVRRAMGVAGKVVVLLVVMGFFVYLSNFESRSLAEKYGKRIYEVDQERDRFTGFYHGTRWHYGDYLWFGKRGGVRIAHGAEGGSRTTDDRGQKTDDGRRKVVSLEFYCRTPGLDKEPVVLTVSYEGRVLDEVVFSGGLEKKEEGQTVRRKYHLLVRPGDEQALILEVSRTWIPHEYFGNVDRRELGIGVKVLGL